MRKARTAYELARSQVMTPPNIVRVFWKVTHTYRRRFSRVLDMGAGDGRFAIGGRYSSYEGIEIDDSRHAMERLPHRAKILYGCAFEYDGSDYAACVGNPPYVRHHDLDERWRDALAKRLRTDMGVDVNRKCNLYVYFILLALLKASKNGIVSILVPYEWVSRPSAEPLRDYIRENKWHVDAYRFSDPIFDGVLTTASISVIDKRNRDGQWRYMSLSPTGHTKELEALTGSKQQLLKYEDRGELWAMRGMSPGTQKVFTLTEGERIHAGLKHEDVLPCVTSLRECPANLTRLTEAAFRTRFIQAGARCWLIRSHEPSISLRLRAYLDSIPKKRRDTWTCNSRDLWYRYALFDAPGLLVGTGFTKFGPKVLVNSIGAHAIGSVCGVYASQRVVWSSLVAYLKGINFEDSVVPHAKELKKVEIRQLNAVLNGYVRKTKHHA